MSMGRASTEAALKSFWSKAEKHSTAISSIRIGTFVFIFVVEWSTFFGSLALYIIIRLPYLANVLCVLGLLQFRLCCGWASQLSFASHPQAGTWKRNCKVRLSRAESGWMLAMRGEDPCGCTWKHFTALYGVYGMWYGWIQLDRGCLSRCSDLPWRIWAQHDTLQVGRKL